MIALVTSFCFALVLQDSIDSPAVALEEWTRKVTGENVVSIELASRKYEAEGKPALWLIGVAHVADSSFYEEVTSLLDEMDIVLYESVRPNGSRQPFGVTDEAKITTTKESMDFVADVAKRTAEELGEISESLEDVIADAAILDRRLSSWVEDASVGAWGRPYSMQVNSDTNTITLWCFGSDGKVGGEGSASDITVKRTVDISDDFDEGEISEQDKEQGIQEDMADALGLEFQLDALSYEDPNWFCSDLTIGEVEQKLEERGGDPTILNTITGEAFTAKIASGMMKLIPILDSLTGGGIRETARLLLIELLTMPNADQMMDGIEPELAQVIIVDRNTKVLGDIAAFLETADGVSTIGVLYGAGHMYDLAARLQTKFGYLPVEDSWIVAMTVNPNDSLLEESDLKRMRFRLQYQIHKQKEAKNK